MKRFRETDEMNTLARNFVCNSIGIKEYAQAGQYNHEAEDRLLYLLCPFHFPKHDPYVVYLDSCTFADIWTNDQGRLESGDTYFKVMKPLIRFTAFSWAFIKKPICSPFDIRLEQVPGAFLLS
jgi:hypothetical protein